MPRITLVSLAVIGAAHLSALPVMGTAQMVRSPSAPSMLPVPANTAAYAASGREDDARVARIAFRLAVAGRGRCPAPVPAIGLVLQHLSQFQPADRAGIIAALALDRGPAVIVLVPDGPAALAGVRTGDVLLSIDGVALPPDVDRNAPFSVGTAHARADAVDDLLARAAIRPFTIGLLRDGALRTLRIDPVLACPGRVRLARSDQHNAYADPNHVYLTTGLVVLARNDDELAFVIAHEMAHVVLKHPATMRGDTVHRGLGRTLGRSGAIIRNTERAADRLGGQMMLDAGYDPVAGAQILRRLGGLEIGLFATHDSAGDRTAAMRALTAGR